MPLRCAAVQEQADIDARVRADIAHFGWHLVMIPPTPESTGWVHTIGLSERFEHPELIVFGNDFSVLSPLLNALGERIRGGVRFEPGSELSNLLEGLPLVFRGVAPKWIEPFLGNAAWHYKRDRIEALQCFWPDPAACFPWQPEFEAALREDQPLLYEHETHRALTERMIAALRADGAL